MSVAFQEGPVSYLYSYHSEPYCTKEAENNISKETLYYKL